MAGDIYFVDDSASGRVVATAQQLRDARTYQKLKAEAQRRGTSLEILPDDEFAAVTKGENAPTPAEPDDDAVITGADGKKYLSVPASAIRSHNDYVKSKERAAELGVELWVSS